MLHTREELSSIQIKFLIYFSHCIQECEAPTLDIRVLQFQEPLSSCLVLHQPRILLSFRVFENDIEARDSQKSQATPIIVH